ncbi:MAG: hypothetical protein NUK63_03255 [Candidatus Bathyarchaeum tardum]|nr:MAG: hypothetical protein NUK63_03255 [Candidatus Bathyarchaeum tardum]
MEIQFVVDAHSWKSKAGQVPEYKVSLKNSDGHTLVLVGSSRAICEKFPKDEVFTVKIGSTQTTLDEVPEG